MSGTATGAMSHLAPVHTQICTYSAAYRQNHVVVQRQTKNDQMYLHLYMASLYDLNGMATATALAATATVTATAWLRLWLTTATATAWAWLRLWLRLGLRLGLRLRLRLRLLP